MIKRFASFAAAWITAVSLSVPAAAQQTDDWPDNFFDFAHAALIAQPQGPEKHIPEPFSKGSWTVDTFFLTTTDIGDNEVDQIFGGGIGVSHYLWDGFALRGELIGLGIGQTGDDAVAAGFSLLARWHFFRRERFSLFVEGGAGILQSDVSVPDGSSASNRDGTHFNFTPQAGVGATWRLNKRMHLIGGARYLHISNADLSGDDENPGSDSLGGYIGLMWTF